MGSRPPDFAPADNPASDSDSCLTRTLSFLYLPAFNFLLLLCPQWLSFDWSMEAIPLITSLLDLRNVFSLVFYCGLGQMVFYSVRGVNVSTSDHTATTTSNGYLKDDCKVSKRKSHRPLNGMTNNHQHHSEVISSSVSDSCFKGHVDALMVALAILILPFIPATNLFFYVGFVVAERVLYVPSMGFCLLIALGVRHLHQTVIRKKLFLTALGFVIIIMCLRTLRRNADWQTEENLYRSGIPINPPKAYGNLANILSAQGKKEEAEWAYKKALSYRSNMADVHYNLGILLQEQKRYDEALQSYRLAIQFRPRMAMAHLNLGLVLGILSRKEEAAEVYRHCSQLDGTGLKDPRTHETTKISALFNLGRLFADDGKYEAAITVYKEATLKMPLYYQPQSLYNMLGEAYFKLEKYEEAEQWYKEALRVKPDHIPAHLTYGKMLARQNRTKEAEKWFTRAKLLAPNDSSVFQHYGQFLAEIDRHVEAAEHYVRAAQLSPDEYEIVFNAANTLRQAGHNEEAEKYYQNAVRIRPHEATSHMNLGAMLHVNGKLLEAEASYLEALRLKPEDAITNNNLNKLRNLLVKKGLRTDSPQPHNWWSLHFFHSFFASPLSIIMK
uniref:dolichyl-phosphate-mannose--protein mannosyltransferase n=1 Tax=Strigamia maritima TaxID=126957 RepID=T1JJZ4_STRMM